MDRHFLGRVSVRAWRAPLLRSWAMRVHFRASYEPEPDKYFWLREAPDGSEIDGLRRRVAAVVDGLPFRAQMVLDSAVAGESRGAPAIVQALPDLPLKRLKVSSYETHWPSLRTCSSQRHHHRRNERSRYSGR